jgi:hypothetical protein
MRKVRCGFPERAKAMTENSRELKLDLVREEAHKPLSRMAEKLMAGLGENLRSITVVGSSVTGDFVPGVSDINTVLVLGKHDMDSLKVTAALAGSMRKRKIAAPLLMTASYIDRSRDVFPVEFLDFQLMHQTILGEDPFAGLVFAKKDVRLQCERELKAALVRLNQGYITAAGKSGIVRDILISASISLASLLRAMLWLKDVARPVEVTKVFAKAAVEFGIMGDSVKQIWNWKYSRPYLSGGDIAKAFETIWSTADRLAIIVDELEV